MDDTVALRRRIKHLQAQVADLIAERDIARFGQQYAVTELARINGLTHGPADLPSELVHALRSHAPQRLQGVWLTAADTNLHVLVDGAGYDTDLGAEDKVWTWIVDHAVAPPAHPFQREDMPNRLYGVGWGTGQVSVSTTLCGQDVITAYRALKPHRRPHLMRTLGMLLIPCSGAGRAVAAALRDAQTAASAATTTATSAATATIGSALPAVTAAAISCTAVTSCTAPGSVMAPQPPAHVHVIDHGAPIAVEAEQPQPRKRTRLKPPPDETEQETIPASARVSAPRQTPASPPGKVPEAPAAGPVAEIPGDVLATVVPTESPSPPASALPTTPVLDGSPEPSPTSADPAPPSPPPPGPAQDPTPLEPASGGDTEPPADDGSPLSDLPEPEQPLLPVTEPASV